MCPVVDSFGLGEQGSLQRDAAGLARHNGHSSRRNTRWGSGPHTHSFDRGWWSVYEYTGSHPVVEGLHFAGRHDSVP